MTTCRAWTTTSCAGANPRCTWSSTRPRLCWWATPSRPSPSRCWPRRPWEFLPSAGCGPQAEPERDAALDHFGKRIGLLFQVVDDILDAQADTATLGKTAGKDAAQDKPTFVSLLGLSDARVLAQELLEESLASLAPFGDGVLRLSQLARFIAHRKF